MPLGTRSKKSLRIVLLLVGLVLINVLASLSRVQVDLTEDKRYTLSPGSYDILAGIEEPIELKFYFSRDVKEIPILFKNHATRIEGLLTQYVAAADGALSLQIIDPKPDSDDESAAVRYGIYSQPLPGGERLFFGLVAIQADQEEVIPLFNIDRERLLEFDISRLLFRVQQIDQPQLGILSSLDFMETSSPDPLNPEPAKANDWVFIQELRHYFTIVPIAETIPDTVDLLAVIHPQDLSAGQQYAIDQYLLSGKPVLIAVDPSSQIQRRHAEPVFSTPEKGYASDLPELFTAWGIMYDAESFVADLAYATPVNTGGQANYFPAWLSIDTFPKDHPATADISLMLLPEAGSFQLNPESELTLTPWITSSRQSQSLSAAVLALANPEQLSRQVQPDAKEAIIAAIIQGTFTSAFPEGRPPQESETSKGNRDNTTETAIIDAPPATDLGIEANDPTAPAKPKLVQNQENVNAASPHRTESNGESTLVLIADTDFLADPFSVRILNFLGVNAVEPFNDNIAFISNALDFLSGSENLIALRSKGTVVRPFKRVEALGRRAQIKYQQQLIGLEERLQGVQARLSELQSQQGEEKRLVLSPEMQEAMEAIRKQEVTLRAERRKIRKKLREDIEHLDRTLALVNLLPIPALVLTLGIYYTIKRNNRPKQP